MTTTEATDKTHKKNKPNRIATGELSLTSITHDPQTGHAVKLADYPLNCKPHDFFEDAEVMAGWLRVLHGDSPAVELRALKCQTGRGAPHTRCGFYDPAHFLEMAKNALVLSRNASPGVYVTLNPVHPDLLSRRNNREDYAGRGETATDANITRRRWALLDFDAVRIADVSATDDEKAAALALCLIVALFLFAAGWPEPIFADSGNGYHLLYRIDLSAEDGGIIERCLKSLAARFDTAAVKIDTSVFNPSRIVKFYGTISRKGDNTPQRPWRRSKIITIPTTIEVVPVDLLESLAATAPVKATSQQPTWATGAQVENFGQASARLLGRIRKYMANVPGAVSGQRGHNATVKAANILVWKFGLTISEALPIFAEWNQTCQPSWDEQDLIRKCEEAFKDPHGTYGELRKEKTTAKKQSKPKLKPKEPPAGDVAAVAESNQATAEAQDEDDESFRLADIRERTELANSRLFVDRFGSDILFIPEWGKFAKYDFGVWEVDSGDVQAMTYAKKVADLIWNEVAESQIEGAADFAVKTSKHSGLRAMINTAASDLAVSHQRFDRDPMLSNCRNGTIDLNTGELLPFRREDYLMKMGGVDFIPDAPCDRWLKFNEEIFVSKALCDFVQRLAGYFLTGQTKEQVLPIFHGIGANGKTTWLTAVQTILGDYARQAPRSLLTMKKQEQHPTELAMLFNVRLAVASETEHGCRFAEALVKSLTGSDPISARRMREDFWDFLPTHKLVLCTNHKPRVKGTDYAIWRRLLLVPFTQVFTDGKKDPDLPGKLAAEGPGILAWMVRGCLEWQRIGLAPPAEVQNATNEYRSEQDVLGRFTSLSCHVGSNAFKVRFGQWYDALEAWCNENGNSLPSRTMCGVWLKEQGFQEKHSNGCWYIGLALKASDPASKEER